MQLTYGEAKKVLAEYAGKAGKCASSQEVDFFCRTVFQYLLTSGESNSLRKYCFHAVDGCFTAPPDIETILKARIDGEVANIWDRWFEWYNSSALNDCGPQANAIYEEPSYFATAYDIPRGGSRIGVLGMCKESEDAFLVVKGRDKVGNEIVTVHKGNQVVGEHLSIKETIRYTTVLFGSITGIVKSKTNGYVQLYAVDHKGRPTKLLSAYSPLEETPGYKRFRLTMDGCPRLAKVSVLARVRVKENYADNDLIPFDNIYVLQMGGQHVQANYGNQMEVAKAKDSFIQELVGRDASYKKPSSGQPFDMHKVTSPGSIKNIV